MGVGYGTVRYLLEREVDEKVLGCIEGKDEIFQGTDEHNFRHQELLSTAVRRDDRNKRFVC